jgi:ATP-dependent helicase/nuclease subunit A|uniref:UvrD-helicase domain-containing protein n=1 Tax=Cephaloticoccus sp. TaxID=1985742 RepID=UPI00404A944E
MKIGHEMILASAGSGKTYALTNRFVRLLVLGAKPERIVALTFTRKAAGEFFDEILKKLAQAANDPTAAEKLAKDIKVEGTGCAEFLGLLRTVVDAMHRLKLGTFDGFFARIARNFPFELGLTGEFEILQSYAEQAERSKVMHRMFVRSGRVSAAQKDFIEAFKLATFGTDDKRPGARLSQFIEDYQETFLAAPERDRWGNPARIWPEGTEWFTAVKQRESAVKTLRSEIAMAELKDAQQARWDLFFADLAEWSPGVAMGKGLGYLLSNALKVWPGLEVITVERVKQTLSPPAAKALGVVVQAVIGAELGRRIAMTQGIYAVISSYEAIYHDSVRRAGKLSFADVQRLLLPHGPGGRMLSGEVGDDRRLLIDFRLDAEIDHWLLDEFQDTSFGQWSVLRNLIDEAVQDPSGTRSLFYVGDVKQAIYAWRDGDPRLFREIFNRYNEAQPDTIAERHLVDSWRSGPPVIGMVNQVFGNAAVLTDLFPGEASVEWNREWREHSSAKPKLVGQAALLHGEDQEARFATTLQLLHEIKPLERGLTVAVLVQKNSTATELADYLRRLGGLPAVAESDLHVCVDNPVGAALLALIKATAHPGDSLAWEHVRMTPLGNVLAAEQIDTPAHLTDRVLQQIYNEGFEATCHAWWQKLESKLAADDEFSRLRARQFFAAAAQFDTMGGRDAAEFVDFMTRHTVRESDSAAVVRVMTIHKAKGLGFDLVILPDLEGQKLDQAREGLAVQRTDDHEVEWVLDMPTKDFAMCDDVLASHLREAESAGCYEKLSLLYVAMTRAKRGLYLVMKPPGKSSSRNFTKLLEETLGGEEMTVSVGDLSLAGSYGEGDFTWHRQISVAEEPNASGESPRRLDPRKVKKSSRLIARRPSDAKSGSLPAAMLFAVKPGGSAVDFGRQLHGLLAEVEWADAATVESCRLRWCNEGEAGRQAMDCLLAPELAGVWSPSEGAGLWRERMFEMVVGDTWVTGVFDRVVIENDVDGRPQRARVYDFKTDDEMSGAIQRHARQLELYRQATSRLLGIADSRVGCFLVMTRTQRCLEVPPV